MYTTWLWCTSDVLVFYLWCMSVLYYCFFHCCTCDNSSFSWSLFCEGLTLLVDDPGVTERLVFSFSIFLTIGETVNERGLVHWSGGLVCGASWLYIWTLPPAHTFYYESIKRKVKIKCIYECRCCYERLQTKTKEFTLLGYTGLVVEPEHLKIETRLIDEKFANAMGEYVTQRWQAPRLY